MKQPLDLSIGQRLAIAFGLLLFMLAAFVGVVSNWNARSTAAEDRLVSELVPLNEQVSVLERALFQTSVAARNYLLSQDGAAAARHRAEAQQARATLARLGELPMSARLAARYREVRPVVEQYLNLTESATAAGLSELDAENRVAALREARREVVTGLQRFGAALEQDLRDAIGAMGRARDSATEGLWTGAVFTALFFVLIGYFTARAIRQPTMRLLRVAAALEQGDWQPALAWAPARNGTRPRAVTGRNEVMRLGRAFGAAAAAIESREQRMRAASRIASAKASSLDPEQVATAALAAIVEHVDAQVGAVYWREREADVLVPLARFGINGKPRPVHLGEGVPGQAARERRAVVLRRIPRDSEFAVKLGYDQAPPRTVVAVPVVFRDEVYGVVLVASLRDLDEEAVEFLADAGRQLGIGFQNLRAHAETERLLAEVREKNERIQAQNEELQAQNEEIQAQTEEIQAQNEEIQAQNEEIQAQNEEIQAQNEELKRHAEELRAHSDMLAEADARKNEFLGVLAHELRNPLAAITNSLVIARRTAPGGEQALRAQAVIERQAQQLIRLIDDLLDVTRVSQGKIRIQRERLDLVDVVHTCIEDQRAALEANELEVELELPEHGIWVDGDRARLCQVLGNLLNNAIKFTDRGKRITVALRPQPDGQVALHVIDRGIGIDPAFLPQLFQPFNQAAITRERANTGLGLGLALVKELVRLHGGSVEARSEGRGRGAEFIVRLPQRGPGEAPAADEVAPHGSARRILIVEDNEDVADTLQDLLALEGHEVEMASSGAEALERAWRLQPHVVLCDIGLPDMDGYEVARRLRADERLRDVLLVALTGYTSSIDKQRAAAAGFDHHLPKPPSIERMREIFQASERRRADRES